MRDPLGNPFYRDLPARTGFGSGAMPQSPLRAFVASQKTMWRNHDDREMRVDRHCLLRPYPKLCFYPTLYSYSKPLHKCANNYLHPFKVPLFAIFLRPGLVPGVLPRCLE